jgi:8-oxo-dGTP diphosphatase
METINKNSFSLATDILIFSISSAKTQDCRKLKEKLFSILLVKSNKEPFVGQWCIPGGFIEPDETIDSASDRVLLRETNLSKIYKEQLYTFGDIDRDPRGRVVTTAYMALIDKSQIKDELSKEAAWFNIEIEEKGDKINVNMIGEDETISIKIKKILRDKTTGKYDYIVLENDKLAFDHPLIIMTGISRLKHEAKYTDIVFNMLPKRFTLGELQQVYEIILNKKLLDPAFRRIIADKVVKTNEIIKTGGHRPSSLYKYKK